MFSFVVGLIVGGAIGFILPRPRWADNVADKIAALVRFLT